MIMIADLFLYLRTVSYLIIAFFSILSLKNVNRCGKSRRIRGFLFAIALINFGFFALTVDQIINSGYHDFLRTWMLTPFTLIAAATIFATNFIDDKQGKDIP